MNDSQATSGAEALVDDPSALVYQRLGALTRALHDSLRQLGYDRHIESAVSSLPDARTRLAYIAKLTGDSAEKVLNAVDRANSIQERLAQQAEAIEADLRANPAAAVGSGRVLNFIHDARIATEQTGSELTAIMMAQDFHDLTGQVVRKVGALAQDLEAQLLNLLLEASPAQKKQMPEQTGWLNGPAMDAAKRTDVVQNQAQVDDLLESLGF